MKMETNDYDQKTSTYSLFPSANLKTETNMQTCSLFPSGSNSVTALPTHNETDLSWLSNRSYTEETEKKLVKFQEELEQYQKKLRTEVPRSDSENSVDCSPEQVNERKSLPSSDIRKRHYSCSDDSSEDRREHELKKKKKKHKHKKKHKKDSHQDLELKGTSEKTEIFSKNKIFLEELGDVSLSLAYRIDRCSDQNSWTYGSLYKPQIARYKHFSPLCLGSSKLKQVLLYEVKKSSKYKPWDNRYFGKENRSCIRCAGEPVHSGMTQQSESTENFVELKPASQEKDTSLTDVRQRILDESTSAYVKGQSTKEQFHTGFDTEPTVKGPLDRKVEEFNKKLREDPHNIKMWLDFLKFQDVLFSEGGFWKDNDNRETEKVKVGSQALLDKKLSILDKAFEVNPASIDLHLRKLELCSEFWEPARINKELENLLFVHPANLELWSYYLRFNQSRISIFTVSKVTKLYHKCFKTLCGILEGKVQTHSVPDDLQARVLGIFYKYCLFLKETGYKEKALTSIQAMLEFNLFCPPALKSASRETKMAAFEEYWDSGSAKLGFPGALGWKHWFDHKEQAPPQTSPIEESLEELEENIIEKKLLKNDTWLQIETMRETHHWLPWQPDRTKGQTEEDCEDPERLVMLDDISPVLFTVADNLHIELVNFFLLFSGISLISCYLMTLKSFFRQFILKNSSLENVLFDSNKFSFLRNKKLMPENLRNFMALAVQQLTTVFKGWEQTVLYLMLIELHMQMISQGKKELSKSGKKEIRKIVKNILKEEHNRNNLVIWHAYVSMERWIGKPGEAGAILETALTIHSGKDLSVISEETLGLLSLYQTYCEITLQIQPQNITALWKRQETASREVKDKVVQILYCALESRKFALNKLETLSGTALLRMRSKFKRLTEAAVSRLSAAKETTVLSTDYMYFLDVCSCSALFEYCCSGFEPSQAVYKSARQVLQAVGLKERQLQQAQADLYKEEIKLVLYHMASVSTSLNVLRNSLDTVVDQFPRDSDFLRLFVDVEKQSRIAGRLNRCFDKLTRSPSSPVPALVAIWSQLDYLDRLRLSEIEAETGVSSSSGIVHRARSWLERCLDQSNIQHCPLLWRLYFILEMQYGERSRLKGVFYRSIQQCPWAKELYLDGIEMFGDQLQELVDMMTEKEIHVQIPVEELDILISD